MATPDYDIVSTSFGHRKVGTSENVPGRIDEVVFTDGLYISPYKFVSGHDFEYNALGFFATVQDVPEVRIGSTNYFQPAINEWKPFSWFRLLEDPQTLTSLTIEGTAFLQNGGSPNPSILEVDLLVDGSSILSTPLTLPASGAFSEALTLASSSVVIPALAKVQPQYRVTWSGDIWSGEHMPYATGVKLV